VPKNVLVVEDEFLIAMTLQLLLEEQGWQVMGPSASVRNALRLLESDTPTVALLDVNLGGEMVTPVAEVLRARRIPFAISSAYDVPERVGGDVLAGAPNVGKPTDERRLLSILAQLTES
jgi:two-component system, response regulator PdtaR